MFEKNCKRRLIYNDDADQQYSGFDSYGYPITDDQSFLKARTTPTFDTQVDTYVWCLGNGCSPPWGAVEGQNILPCLGSSENATNIIVDACHKKGVEVWGSLRMNDIHDSFMAKTLSETHDPLKAQHPEYLIGAEADNKLPGELTERFLWTAFDYARPEVRQYRLDFIEKTAREHDFDGYELDFTRFIWNFALGEERQLAHHMTDLLRQVRSKLNEIGDKRGRPYTLVVHVMDNVQTSQELGQDVITWLNEGLVDVLAVGMGYMPYVLNLEEWLALGKAHGVPVYPSVNTNTYIPVMRERFDRREVWQEAILAHSAWFYQQGADGQYLFNVFCLQDKSLGAQDDPFIHAPLVEAGESATLEHKDKMYMIQSTGRGGFCHHGSAPAPLPIALDKVERKLPLAIGPDGDNPVAKFTLRIYTTGGNDETTLRVRLNHTLLEQITRHDGYVEVAVPNQVVRSGFNELALWCNQDVLTTDIPMIVHEVYVHVTY